MKTEKLDEITLTYDDSPEAKERIFQMALAWFKEQGHFNGESLQQCDSTFVEGPTLLTNIAEKGFKFDYEWHEDEA